MTDFDFDAVDRSLSGEPEDIDREEYSLANLGSAVNVLIEWIVGSDKLDFMAGRALALQWFLRPENSKYGSLAEIADLVGCKRATLSKSLLQLRDFIGLRVSAGKLHGARRSYRDAQQRSVCKGTHASFVVKAKAEAASADALLDAVGE